jgi:dolichol kinase
VTPVVGEPPVSNRKSVAAYVFMAIVAAVASGAATTTGKDYGAAVAFGFGALVAGAIAVFVAGPPPR